MNSTLADKQKQACRDILNLLSDNNITEFSFKGKKSKYKLWVKYDD